jgi:hypothetical protein
MTAFMGRACRCAERAAPTRPGARSASRLAAAALCTPRHAGQALAVPRVAVAGVARLSRVCLCILPHDVLHRNTRVLNPRGTPGLVLAPPAAEGRRRAVLDRCAARSWPFLSLRSRPATLPPTAGLASPSSLSARETFGHRGTPVILSAVCSRFIKEGANGHRHPRHLDVIGRNGSTTVRPCRCKKTCVEACVGWACSVPGSDSPRRS